VTGKVAALRRPLRYYGKVDGAAMRSQAGETRSRIGIIGAGPAGAAAALRLGQLGVPDVVLVDRDEFPRDETCGSGVSPKGIQTLKRLGVWDLVEPRAYWIRGVRLVTPRDLELCLASARATRAS
jgi:2-polyprenyl-6-methoxyphenol hydroxylase-like FAD-dependent oxidoreductase